MSAAQNIIPSLALLCAASLSLTGCASSTEEMQRPWFGGYTDVMSFPEYEFSAAAAGQAHVVLAFVVADPEDPCAASWGGAFDLDEAATELELDRQVADLRRSGGEVVISFGGAAGSEVATTCTDPEALYHAYRSVIDRYDVDMVDFDIEMNDLVDSQANQRRADALVRLQKERAPDDPLRVWLTLPVQQEGLEVNAQEVVGRTLGGGVDLSGVNIMTMSFGSGRTTIRSMVDASTDAALASHDQLSELFAQAGRPLSGELMWNRMGLTPMIGQNDVREQVLDLDAAAELNKFARRKGMGRISYWSLNRDRPCGPEVQDHQRSTYNCSGIEQKTGDFTRVLGAGFDG
jgi:chitinase